MERKQTANAAGANGETLRQGRTETPDVDIYVNDDEILLVADLPGVDREHMAINMEDNSLTIEATFTAAFSGSPQRQEFDSTHYRRVFTLPKGLDLEKSSAELRQGVLYLHLPKSAAAKPCRIEVRGE